MLHDELMKIVPEGKKISVKYTDIDENGFWYFLEDDYCISTNGLKFFYVRNLNSESVEYFFDHVIKLTETESKESIIDDIPEFDDYIPDEVADLIFTTSSSETISEAPEQEREEETADDLTEDRKTVYVDDFHLRFLRSEMVMIQKALYYYGMNYSLHNEDKLLYEYVTKLVNKAVIREYDSAVFHVDCDPYSDDDELPI